MLGIKDGVEPSFAMRNKAIGRQINAVDGIAEELPYPDKSYDYALMLTTICFVDDISKSFREVHRILKKNGKFIIGFVDKNSPIGRTYFENKSKSVFYTDAVFYSSEEVYRHLWENNYKINQTWQTVFGTLQEICEIQTPEKGYGRGSFVVVQAIKK
jgi:ubiquinone/menaquinone biosynthesis C-methylase UbiE